MKPTRFLVEDSAVMKSLTALILESPYQHSVTTPYSAGLDEPLFRSDYGGVVFASKWSLFSFVQNAHPDVFLRNKIQASIEATKLKVYEDFAKANDVEFKDSRHLEESVRKMDLKKKLFGPDSLTERLAVSLEKALLEKPVVSFLKVSFNADKEDLYSYEVKIEAGFSFALNGENPSLEEGACVSHSKYAYPDTVMMQEEPDSTARNIARLCNDLCLGLMPRKPKTNLVTD
ncbi:hypothetical protein [Bdellovibrio sp. BCCA]|uniref:hypothetical protein n=1 Tax=Bdellovibrio sp. BCCA TaxID=3136281 RepID=UPI0030F17A69